MRVLIVHDNPASCGGAEAAVRDQLIALKRVGADAAVCYEDPFAAGIYKKFDFVHFHTIHDGLGLNVLKVAQDKGVPHCLSLHDYWPFCKNRMLLYRHSDQSCPAAAGKPCDLSCGRQKPSDMIGGIINQSPSITFSPYAKKIFEANGIHVTRVIPHGIDHDLFCPGQKDYAKIISVSAWPKIAAKGMRHLAVALNQLRVHGVVVSNSPREQVAHLLKPAGVFVMPSMYQETFGLVLTEAMAAGCLCIATNVAGPRYQLEGTIADEIQETPYGVLVPAGNPRAIAQAIIKYYGQPDLCEPFSENAREKVAQQFTLEAVGRRLTSFFEEILNG